jgi:hypothetical protein
MLNNILDATDDSIERNTEEDKSATVENSDDGNDGNTGVDLHDTMYLLTAPEMEKRKPSLIGEPMSIHVQDQGYGPIAVFTFRKSSSERVGDNTDALGEVTEGIWKKLLEVMVNLTRSISEFIIA